MFAGQHLATGHVPRQGAQHDLPWLFTAFAALAVAFVFEHQGEALQPGLTGIQPAGEAGKQATHAEHQGVHLVGGGRQGQVGDVALGGHEPWAGVGNDGVGAIELCGDGPGVAPGQATAGQALHVGEAMDSDPGEQIEIFCRHGATTAIGHDRDGQGGQGRRQPGFSVDQATRGTTGQPARCQRGGGDRQLPGKAELAQALPDACTQGCESAEETQAGLDFEQQGVGWVEADAGSETAGPGGDLGQGCAFKGGRPLPQVQLGR